MDIEHTGLQNIRRIIGTKLDLGHLFTVQPAEVRTAPPLGLEMHIAPNGGVDDYGLSVECMTGLDSDPSSVEVSARFDEAVISRALLARLLDRFQHTLNQCSHFLSSAGQSKGVLVGDLDMISPKEASELALWNSQMPPQKQALVHELVRQAGLVRPEAPAICSWDGHLSHAELDVLVQRLAHRLAGLGVGPEDAVPVCFDKSKWVIVSILAVLRAGGVVVPISAEPFQRAQAILDDTQAQVVLTTCSYAPRFSKIAHVVVVDHDLFASLPVPTHELAVLAKPSNAAFIIYTSGSTGTPKGVVLEHASMSTSMQAHGARFGMGPDTRAFQFASFTFDISLHDMITTLQFGGCVCMPSEEERMADAAGAMRRMRVNYTFLPPRVLPTLDPSAIPGLKTLVVGGEATQAEHMAPWLGRMRVYNAYGPAECCIVSTCTELVDLAQMTKIGHALAAGLWVVDETDPGRLLPVGSVGELLIEGPLLARGYLNDPDKSSAAFIANPAWLQRSEFANLASSGSSSSSSSSSERRLYRTGDLVRQNDDGSLTYVGRRDSQVKIRGQRVEIGEIEHHLKRHESVCDAAVLHPTRGPARSRLVALLSLTALLGPVAPKVQPTAPEQASTANALVRHLREQLFDSLPSYMVPSAWISLRFLPQNSSNKIDRRKLTQWLEGLDEDELDRITHRQEDDMATSPQDDLQKKLQMMIVDILRIPAEKVAMNRSFLSLGGDSISAMQVVSHARLRHGISMTVRDVLQSSSIAQLAGKATAGAERLISPVEVAKTTSSPLATLLKQLQETEASNLKEDVGGVDMTFSEMSRLRAEIMTQACIQDFGLVEDVFPCSPIQQGIIISQIKGHATYAVWQVCQILPSEGTGRVDLDRLSWSWESVVRRHPMLRTVFVQSSTARRQRFYQVVLSNWQPSVRIVRPDGVVDVAMHLAQEKPAVYEPGEPPHSLSLCATQSGSSVYAKLEISHALVDASSLGLVLRDVVLAYEGALPDVAAPSYSTYVDFLQRTPEDESLAFWKHRLADAQPCYLPPSTTPETKTRRLQSVSTRIESAVSLHAFRDAHGVTLANLMQLAWAVVLSRYTGSADSIFGYLTNGRDVAVPGADEIVGPMINMMVARVQLEQMPPTVAQAARRVQDDFFEAFPNQRTSLGSIHHALRLPSGQSLFNTTVSYFRRSPQEAPTSSALTVRAVAGEDPTEYDANLRILASDDRIELSVQYSTHFMDRETARLVLESFKQTLLSISASPSAPLNELPSLTASDIEKLRSWNSAVPHIAEPDCVHNAIRQQCLSRPDAQAVCAWDGTLGYAELAMLSDRLAAHLQVLGVGKEVTVGFCFEKSMWAIVAMLAVLKAGGVVVPLGIQFPQQRLELILENTKPAVVLTTERHVAKFEGLDIPHRLIVSAASIQVLPDPASVPPVPELGPEDAAVIIYTSGSTGVPKGVVLTHGSLSASLDVHGAKVGLGIGTRALQYSAYVFDLSLLDILGTLRFGGCVCVISEDERMDLSRLAATIGAMKVNFAVLTPTVAGILAPTSVPCLETLVLAGEAVQPTLVETWSTRVVLFNGYGPAECTVLSTISGPVMDKDRSGNVGNPLAVTTWVVDQEDYNSLVPIGAVGELLIEGPLLARGYLHDPEKTAAAFITDPGFVAGLGLAASEGRDHPRRMYRTGDLVRQSPVDGSITYVGRRDSQVKIRGQRLEVGDVEYWTRRAFPQAQMVAADLIAPASRNGEPMLVVVLELPGKTGEGDVASSAALPFLPATDALRSAFCALRDALVDALPPYMVPSLYIPAARIPLSASGKLDRKHLRSLLSCLDGHQLSQYAPNDAPVPSLPLAGTETRLRDLWVSALGVTGDHVDVGPSSHFFRLGGDSVTAMRLAALAADTEPVIRLTVADVFKHPVLRDMSSAADAHAADVSSATSVDAPPPFSLMPADWNAEDGLSRIATRCDVAVDAIEDAYPCTPLQEGLLALTAREPSAYVGRWVFKMDDTVDSDRLRAAWERVSDAAPILRTRALEGEDGQASVQVVVRGPLRWEAVSCEVDQFISHGETEPIGFGTELTRLAVVTASTGRFFVWTAHHSVYDGWTARKVLEAVRAAYTEEEMPTFAPYTRFIQYLLRSNASRDADEYWRSQVKGATDVGSGFPIVPPNHRPGPSSSASLHVPAAEGDSTVTTATLLRAAWALVLCQETGSSNVHFAAPLSGRTAPVPGILDIAAPTLATVPVCMSIDRNSSVSEFLASVQKQATEMIAFEHVGLQRINQILAGRALVINHLFVVQPFSDRPGQETSLLPPGLTAAERAASSSAFHRQPLVLECNTGLGQEDGGVKLEAYFDEAVISPERMQSILGRLSHFFVQLRAASASTEATGKQDIRLSQLQPLAPKDVASIRKWNTWTAATRAPGSDECVHELFRQQALLRPGDQAVCAWDGELSYGDLDTLSLRLACHLAGLGVGPEVPVPMIFEKSVWAVVAQLAILRSGGVIVPIGHKYPIHRVRDVIQSTGANILLSSRHSGEHTELVRHVLAVDEALLRGLPSGCSSAGECSHAAPNPSNAAFILFTSGSTGVPKGVVLEHQSLATSLRAERDLFAPGRTRALQFASYTFDVSIAETFVPLISGGCVCIPSEDDRVSNLAGAMERMAVDLAFLTPTVAGLLRPEQVPRLETLVFLGEALRPEVATPWVNSPVRVFNAYGPTECSINSTSSCRITDPDEAPCIGTAIAGVNLWVVDPSDHQRLVPIGTPGELFIEGPLLARGYLGDPERTVEAFVTSPAWLEHSEFGPTQGRRFYRTGDLVQQAYDGSIAYLGRRDTQVKLHGQRLEIGEIEHWIEKMLGSLASGVAVGLLAPGELTDPSVPEPVLAVVVEVRRSSVEAAQEVVVVAEQASLSVLPLSNDLLESFSQLKGSLVKVLPPYMVPQMYIPVNKLPTTDSGKLDRRVVWATIGRASTLSQYSLAIDRPKMAPRTATEKQLQRLWASVLRKPVDNIGATDDFFQSGGDSISAMRLVAKSRDAGDQMRLTVGDIFRCPILSDLAALLDGGRTAALPQEVEYRRFSSIRAPEPGEFVARSVVPLLTWPGAVIDVAPVTDFQALSVVCTLRTSRDLLAHVTLDSHGPCDIERWRESCWNLIERHETLRTAYVFVEELLQVVLEEWRPDIPHFAVDIDEDMEAFTKKLISEDMNRTPRLGQPFVEFAIITTPTMHRIVFRASHAEYDAISISYFLGDLAAIYAGELTADRSSSFMRYVSGLGLPEAQANEQSRRFWKNLLEDASMPAIAPPNRVGPSTLIRHATRSASLAARRPGPDSLTATPATLVRTAWGLTLARYTGLTDVVFGEVVSGRNTGEPAAAGAAGCCVNIVPVRTVFRRGESVRDLLGDVQAQHMARLPHETVGFRDTFGKWTERRSAFFTHVNHADHALQWSLRIGEATYHAGFNLHDRAQALSDIAITSVSHPDRIEVAFGYREGAVSRDVAEQLLSCLCAAIELLSAESSGTMLLDSLLAERGEEILGAVSKRDSAEAEEDDGMLEDKHEVWELIGAGYEAFRLHQEAREVSVDNIVTSVFG